MAVTAKRTIGISFSGDVNAPNQAYAAADNTSSPGNITTQALIVGNNTITPPAGAKAVTIVPPSGNTATMQLKGVVGDTGIRLHLTDPSSIAFDISQTTSFVITVAVTTVTLRFIWS